VRYLSWEDAFDAEFEDGLCILEPHSTIRRANKISAGAKIDRLKIEDWTQRCITTTVRRPKSRGLSFESCRRSPRRSDLQSAEIYAKA
jgi:hypothetical protein